jgi:RNA polymerase sigma-70 factor (ECF subfamily)
LQSQGIYSEKALFLRIAEGDEVAFEQLFHLYVPVLHRIIYQVVQSESAVKDIAQEVFLQLWLGRDKLPAVEEPRHWIHRIAYNLSFRYLRRQLLHKKAAAEIATGQQQSIHQTEEVMQLTEVSRFIRQAVDQLPQQGQRIFRMSRTEGMKPAEIAAALEISVQGVRNSLTRSAKTIRENLEQQGILIPLFLLLTYLP